MPTETVGNGNAEGTRGSIPGPEYTVAVGDDSKAKTRKYTGRKGHVTSRYLRPKIGSCHDRCKSGVRDEPLELKTPGRRLGVRKMWVKKKPARRSVEPVERIKMIKTKPKPIPRPKICARDELTNRRSTQDELKLPKNYVKPKPGSSSMLYGQKNKREIKNIKYTASLSKSSSAEQVASKGTRSRSSPRKHKPESPRKGEESMTKAKLKQLLAEKITEMTLQEAENEELAVVVPKVETIESPLKDEHGMTKIKLNQLIDEKITKKTLHEAEDAELESVPLADEIIEPPLKDEESMTKTKLKELIAEKITEKTLQHAGKAELESVPSTVEVIKSPPTVTTESTNLPSSESSQVSLDKQVLEEERENSKSSSDKQVSEEEHENSKSSSDKQVSEEERENANHVEVNVSEDDDKMVNCEDKENEGSKVKFMKERVVDVEYEDDDPRRLNFRRGKIPDNEDDGPRKLNFRRGKIPDNEDDGPRKLNFRRGKILEDNEDDGPTRLKFRRGKILEVNEDDGPTRLNFRRGKILEDDEDDGPTRVNFRKGKILEDNADDESIAKMNFKKTIVEEATDDGKKESETVTLKHQEMQEKKEAQDLLNRVIEETASKLEVDRKNKVEALVGAFESVISLRDNTPSSQ